MPVGHAGLIVDLPDSGPNSWDSVTLMTALDAGGVRVSIQPAGSPALELVPHFSGWSAIVDDAVARLLPQALDALVAQLPASTLKTDAIAVAQALGVYGTWFGTAPVPLRQLTLDTVVARAAAMAPKVTALLQHAVGANLPGTIAATGANGVAITVPSVLGGRLALTIALADEAVELALTDLALGPVAADIDVRYAGAFSGSIALDLDLSGAAGFDLKPRLELSLEPFNVAVLPLGAGSASAASIVLAPDPGGDADAGRSRADRPGVGGAARRQPARRRAARSAPDPALGSRQDQRATAARRRDPQRERPPEVAAAAAAGDARGAGERDRRHARAPARDRRPHARARDRQRAGPARRAARRRRGDRDRRPREPPAVRRRARAGDPRADRDDLGRASAAAARARGRGNRRGGRERAAGHRRGAPRRGRGARLDRVRPAARHRRFSATPWHTELDLEGFGLPILQGGGRTTPSRSRSSSTPARARAIPSTRAWTCSSASTGRACRSRSPARRPASRPGSKSSAGSGRSTSTRSGSRAARRPSGASCSTTSACSSTARSRWPGCRSRPRVSACTSRRSTSASRQSWSVELDGLALAYKQAMLSIQGGLLKAQGTLDGKPFVDYRGALQVQVGGRGFSALGAYSQPSDSIGAFTSLFVFVVGQCPARRPAVPVRHRPRRRRGLQPPAAGAERAGAGARVPAHPGHAGRVRQRPDEGAASASATRCRRAAAACWVAAGIKFSTFELLKTTALVYVALDRGVEVGLLGLMAAALPTPDKTIASLELALAARYSTVDQVLSVRAQLTDNSWLLSKDCQLTGGFAFMTWFRESRTVLTVGGYHPDFPVPADFPRVPRVGFHWAVGGGIVIKGEAYFAITTSAAMAGGRLEVSYDKNPIRVWFRASLDVLVRFKPFSFSLDAHVSIGAEFRLRICFFACVTITVSVELGATLHLEGPPLRGFVKVDLAIASVKIPFGEQKALPTYLSWTAFRDSFLLGAGRPAATAALPVAGVAATGAETSAPDGSDAKPFRVLPEFALTSDSKLPATQWRFGGGPDVSGSGVASSFLLAAMGPLPALAPLHTVALEVQVGTSGSRSEPSRPTSCGHADRRARVEVAVHPDAGNVRRARGQRADGAGCERPAGSRREARSAPSRRCPRSRSCGCSTTATRCRCRRSRRTHRSPRRWWCRRGPCARTPSRRRSRRRSCWPR